MSSYPPSKSHDPWLLTPGPLTTSLSVKEAMLHDWGSRDRSFIDMNRSVRERLLAIAGVARSHVCVPLQGSGTFAVEAMIGTLVGPADKLAILSNGAYGQRAARICRYSRRAHVVLESPEDTPNDVGELDRLLGADADVTHVFAVHCETTSGILNPLEAIADTVARHGRKLIVDAMSVFGAIAIDPGALPCDALAASSNKCIEGVPGLGFAIVRRESLERSAGHSPALSLDLHDQWQAMEGNGQWRFTPPTHVIAAFHQALLEHEAEGGVAGRGARYRRNCEVLVEGMRGMGFQTLLPDRLQAPIIVTFRMPADPKFQFGEFYDGLSRRGYVIYPGKLTVADSFRIGCIGRLGEDQIRDALGAVRAVLDELGVADGTPA